MSKNSSMKTLFRTTTALVSLLGAAQALPAYAQSLPSGGTVAQGSATIAATANTTTINQTSANAVINWSSFNVGAGNTVSFVQPDTGAATLNRVTGTTSSSIAGQINATGSVYLINPNGIQITSTGAVDAGRGFIASTLDISDDDFMAGRNIFSGTGGAVSVDGSIEVGTGGFVGLLGGSVTTASGSTIVAPAGLVTIGTTTTATLDLNGGNFLQIALPTSAELFGNGNGAKLNADAARDAVRHMVNLPYSLEATAVSGTNGNVTLGGSITAAGGDVNVGALGAINLTGSVNVAGTTTGGNTVTLRADSMGAGYDTVTISANKITTNAGGALNIFYNPTNYANPTNFSGGLRSGGGTLTAYMLVNDLADLQNMNTNLNGNYALSRDFIAYYTQTGEGFLPVGGGNGYFEGIFDGQGHQISGFFINRPQLGDVGLFGIAGTKSIIRNFVLSADEIVGGGGVGSVAGTFLGNMTNVRVSADVRGLGDYVGGLVGRNAGHISVVDVSAWVTGGNAVGGLAGSMSINGQHGIIESSKVDGRVTSISTSYGSGIGGLVGLAYSGSIIRDSSSSSVIQVGVGYSIGGLVGSAEGTEIINSHATGNITTNANDVGGLVGNFYSGSINSSYATGDITGDYDLAGLVGFVYDSTISNSYSSGNVSGNYSVSGFAGDINLSTISNSYSTGDVIGDYNVAGLLGGAFSSNISNVYVTGKVTARFGDSAGLVLNSVDSTITNSYWNTETSGQATSAGGGTGLTSAQMMQAANFTGWSIDSTGGQDNVWRIYEGNTAPLLKNFMTPATITAAPETLVYNGTDQSVGAVTYLSTSNGAQVDISLIALNGPILATGKDVGAYLFDMSPMYSTQQGYDLVFSGDSTLTIVPRMLVVAADPLRRNYGAANPALTYSIGGDGLVSGESLTGGLATAATANSAPGVYDITMGSLAASANYTIEYQGAKLTVVVSLLTPTAPMQDVIVEIASHWAKFLKMNTALAVKNLIVEEEDDELIDEE